MASKKPKTIPELFDFYYEDFKPLYSHLQILNEPPLEMLFEINAAFDHLSRHWKYKQNEEEAVNTACAHLKRACFDAFKIVVRETCDHYNELRKTNTSIIDNGDFDKEMRMLHHKIGLGAIAARQSEGDSRDETKWHEAYELWETVYTDCVCFDKEFYLNEKVEWARRRQFRRIWANRFEGVFISMAASLLVWWLSTLIFSENKSSPQQSPQKNVIYEKHTETKPALHNTRPLE